MKIAWLAYGALTERTGGTIYDAIVVAGLGNVSLVSVTSVAEVVRRLEELRPEVIVGDELCHPELAAVFPRVTFARRVLLVHHLTCWEPEVSPLHRERARTTELEALRHADAVIATSEPTRARLVAEGHPGPIHVVVPGSDRLPVVPAGERAGFLFVGAVIPRKRVRELIDAMPAGAQLRIAGSLERDPAYVAALPRPPNVTFLGEVDDASLSRELASAAALVLPSSLEGFGIAAAEALAAGTPVIATNRLGFEAGSAVTYTADLATTLRELIPRVVHVRLPRWSETVARFRAALAPRVT